MAYSEDFVCIADIAHPRLGPTLDLETYCRERHAAMVPASNAASFETQAMRKLGIIRDFDATTFSFVALPRLVAGTHRLATVHRRLAEQAAEHLPIRILELPFEIPPMRQAIQWHTYRTHDPAIAWLRTTMHEAAEAMGTRLVRPTVVLRA